MSLASEYATRQQAAAAAKVSAADSAPPAFESEFCTASVDPDGACRIVPGPGMNTVIAPAGKALAVAQWIIATFGES